MSKILFSFMLIVLLSGCASMSASLNYRVRTIQDEFDGYTINRMEHNMLGGGSLLSYTTIWLNTQRYQSKEGNVSYSLIAEYVSPDWLFIERGESLILLVDGQRMGLVGDGSWNHRNVGYGRMVSEKSWYNITLEDLQKIANAKEVKVKIIGSQYYAERCFTDANFKNLKRFIMEYAQK